MTRYLLIGALLCSAAPALAQPAAPALAQPAATSAPAMPAKTDSNEPYVKTTCNGVPSNTVTGRVTSSKAIQIPGFDCEKFDGGAGISFNMATREPMGGSTHDLRPCKKP